MTLRALVVGAAHDTMATERPLSSRGWRVAQVDDIGTALAWLRTVVVDVVVLDTEVGADVGLVRRFTRATSAPVLALLQTADEERLTAALEAGADAVLPCPVGAVLLNAQARALTRRRAGSAPREAVEVGPLRLDPGSREVHVHGHPIRLTRIEFDLLSLLMTEPGQVLGRAQILAAVWGEWFGPDHLVEVHLSRMRSKIVRAGGPRVGQAVPGVGYRLLADAQSSTGSPA